MAATLAIWVSLFSVPGRTEPQLDASWQEMLIYAREHGLQFGRDIIFTWGPWGFLSGRFHLGGAEAVPILVWQAAGQLLVALALVALTRSLVPWRRIAFVVAVLAFHWLFLDTVYFALIALITIGALMRPGSGAASLAGWALALGFLAQFKFTYFAISAAAALAAAAYWVVRGSWRRAGAVAGGYGFAVAAAWTAGGQRLDNLYPYLRRSLEISSGYADAMALDESRPVFLWGSALALLCLLFVWRVWRTVPDRAFALCASGYLAFSFFVIWKESFVRADMIALGGHVFGIFTYVLILAPALPGLLFPGRRLHWFDGSILLCLLAVACFDPDYFRLAPRVIRDRARGNVWTLRHIGGLPGQWQQSFEDASAGEALPAIRTAVGKGTVDVYDFSTGIAFLNGLTLSPRPIFQSYTAYTPSLEGWNLRYYQSARAPDFLLWREERVDDRYPGQDDAMLLAALPGHYEPLFEEGPYWLFRRRTPVSGDPPELRMVLGRTVRLAQEIDLPPGRGHAVWLRADAVPSAFGRLRDMLYKPALISISVTDDQGASRAWRLLPRVARAGFILDPRLQTGRDMALLMKGESRSGVRSFHFEAPGGQEKFWSRVDVSVFEMPGLPVRPEGTGEK